MSSAAKRSRAKKSVRLRLRVTAGDEIAVGPGKMDLLEAVAREGSISAAARSIGMSYRRAWLLLDQLNRSLKRPATETAQGGERGGGAMLTPTGETVLRLYRRIERKASASAAAPIAELLALLR